MMDSLLIGLGYGIIGGSLLSFLGIPLIEGRRLNRAAYAWTVRWVMIPFAVLGVLLLVVGNAIGQPVYDYLPNGVPRYVQVEFTWAEDPTKPTKIHLLPSIPGDTQLCFGTYAEEGTGMGPEYCLAMSAFRDGIPGAR